MSFHTEHKEVSEVTDEEVFVLPPSFGQERMWFLQQLQLDSFAYNIFTALRLTGPLNRVALEQGLSEIVRRHEVLRTTFSLVDKQLAQIVSPEHTFRLWFKDMGHNASEMVEDVVKREIVAEAQRPFDLEHGPLFRASLFQIASDEHLLLLVLHHIVFDEWSSDILKRELTTLYEAYAIGFSPSLPALPIQYADFAVWQRQHLQEDEIARQIVYWQQQLAHSPQLLELPTDRPRKAVRSDQGATWRFSLPKDLSYKLTETGRQAGTTLFITLLTAFTVLLHRYSQQEDIVVGTPIANRNQPEVEVLIGFFLNTLALRTDLSGNPSFRQLLGRVHRVALQAYGNQDVPFEKVVNALQATRDLSHHQLFQVTFILENAADVPFRLPGLTVKNIDPDLPTAKFDLSLFFSGDAEHGLQGRFVYSIDLFDEITIEHMTEHFTYLLEQMCVTPDLPVSRLFLLREDERHRLLIMWNNTETNMLQDGCLHDYIEAQVRHTPAATAVTFVDGQLTYQELNDQANRLAQYLLTKGVKSEEPIGICIERSPEMLIGMLGILKAGAAYVPLDPNYPRERLAFMLNDTRVQLLLTRQQFVEVLPLDQQEIICLNTDTHWSAMNTEELRTPECPVHVDHLAAIIYTSGSTGTPKGVMLHHRGLCNRILWGQSTYPLSPSDRVLQSAHFSFDFAIWECFAPLFFGASIVLSTPEGHRDSRYLVELIQKEQVTVAHFIPSMLQHFLDEPGIHACNSLRLVFSGGEALSSTLQERFFASIHADLYNQYGPTEASIDATYWGCKTGREQEGMVPIGHAIANTRLYILDSLLQPVPIGIPGELYLGGAGLARGYLHRPDLTAEKFLPDPFSNKPGVRLYRTGDRVRYLRNGAIEFLGRTDQQVKIRGYRIELGEIEAVLVQHPAIRQCVVSVHEDTYGIRRLIAYSVSSQSDLSIRDVKSFLQDRLPQYMVPSVFMILDNLRLTAQGKVDRNALPLPDTTQLERDTAFVAPRTPLEEQLASIWRTLLHIEQISVDDNFFELGGDSLIGIHMVTMARQAGLHLKPEHLFQHQTIMNLAETITEAQQESAVRYLPLTDTQRWFLTNYHPEHSQHWNILLLLPGTLPITPMQMDLAIESLWRQQDALMLRFEHSEDGWRQYQAPPDIAEASMWFDLTPFPEEEQEETIEAIVHSLQATLNAYEGPLARLAYFDLSPQRPGLFLWAIHTLVADSLLGGVLLQQLAREQEHLAQDDRRTHTQPDVKESLASYFQQSEQAAKQHYEVLAPAAYRDGSRQLVDVLARHYVPMLYKFLED